MQPFSFSHVLSFSFEILLAGGNSLGCPSNAGAAGTFYDAVSRNLIVDNLNMTTDTDTLLMDFPNQPLLTNLYIQNFAKAAVPLLWSRVQVSKIYVQMHNFASCLYLLWLCYFKFYLFTLLSLLLYYVFYLGTGPN